MVEVGDTATEIDVDTGRCVCHTKERGKAPKQCIHGLTLFRTRDAALRIGRKGKGGGRKRKGRGLIVKLILKLPGSPAGLKLLAILLP